jgi:hypothetical protein
MTSTLTYLLVNFNPEAEMIKEYEKIIRKFIWRGRSQVQKQRMEQPLGRGGMNVTSLPDFMAALRIRWYRQLCNPIDSHQNWKTALQFWLKKERLLLMDIPKLGSHDLGILADKLDEKGLTFWAKTFKQISRAAEIWEEQTDNFVMLPVFGGLLAKKANRNGRAKWISFFNSSKPSIKTLFCRYPLLVDLFDRKNMDRTDLTAPKHSNMQQLEPRASSIFGNIMSAVLRAYTNIIQAGSIIIESYPLTPMATYLHYTFMKYTRGASFIYKQLINRKAKNGQMGYWLLQPFKPGQKKIHHMTQNEWFKALDSISKVYITPRAKWNCIQIFFRTIWTLLKDNKSYSNTHSAECLNCFHHTADTMHVYVQCSVARKIWKNTKKIMKALRKLNDNTTLTPQQILFHRSCTDHIIVGLLMASKYAITLVMPKVTNKPINIRVVDTFLKSQILLLCETYIYLHKNTSMWIKLNKQWSSL